MDQPDELISMTEAARLLGVHRTTLVGWLRQGRIPALRYGHHGPYRVRRGDILAFIELSWIAPNAGEAEPDPDDGPSPGAG